MCVCVTLNMDGWIAEEVDAERMARKFATTPEGQDDDDDDEEGKKPWEKKVKANKFRKRIHIVATSATIPWQDAR